MANQRLIVEKQILETAERIVATSPQEREHMRSLVSQKGKIDIIPCGTDIQQFGSLTLCALKRRRFYRGFQSMSLSYPSFRHCLNIGFLP